MNGNVKLIAEIGSTHDGSVGNALRLIDAASDSGAHVAKFQVHLADEESLKSAPNPPYFSKEPRLAYLSRIQFEVEEWELIKSHCEERGLEFLASPFSHAAVDLLESLDVTSYKIPSGEVTNLPLLEYIASLQKPVLLSSGMSTWAELDLAVETLSETRSLTLMQCTSLYPCPLDEAGLNIISELRERYSRPVGFSDHTVGMVAAIVAASLGADTIEKHFTLSRWMYGTDAPLGMEPNEFKELAQHLQAVSQILGNPVDKDDIDKFKEMKEVFEKSIVTARDMNRGTQLTRSDLAFKKPGGGISPAAYKGIIGKTLARDLPGNTQLAPEDIADA